MTWPKIVNYYYVKGRYGDDTMACYKNNVSDTESLWRTESPVGSALPFFTLQLSLIIFFSRSLIFLFKPLRQPPIVAEILAGVLLGPSVFGWDKTFMRYIFPLNSLLALETVANLSLVYHIFLVGLELDLTPILRSQGRSISIAFLGLIIPLPIGVGLHHLVLGSSKAPKSAENGDQGPLFWGIALASTNFPDLSCILSDIKLLHSEIGRTALSAAIITDIFSWLFLVVVVSTSNTGYYYSILSTSAFVLICVFVVRPALKQMIQSTGKAGNHNSFHIGFVMIGVLVCGLITDACGTHSIVGAFIWGAIMPKGELKDMIMAKVEDLIKSVLMPSFFLHIGLRLNLQSLFNESDWQTTITVIFLACTAKFVSTFLVAIFNYMPLRESLTLGSLMNTKGLFAFVIITTGRDLKALGNHTFSLMLVSFLVMTALIGPTLAYTYKSIKNSRIKKYRTIQSIKLDTEFRVVACVHSTRNVCGIINLLEASNPTKHSPLLVIAIHLVELAGAATAMLIVHSQGRASSTKTKVQTDQIITAFDTFESQNPAITVHSLTAVSPYTTMHDDICGIAAEKHVHLIILPFHKQPTLDGSLEDGNPSIGLVNNNVMANTPCSVGILIDRGFAVTGFSESIQSRQQCFAVFFIGGPDDREALTYACKISEHPNINITIMRFIRGGEVKELNITDFSGEENDKILTAIETTEKENIIDNDYIEHIKVEISDNPSISYVERVVNNGDEIMNVISTMENEYKLYIVGRGRGMMSPLVSSLSECSDCPELGMLGDALVTSSFTTNVSILVMQQGNTCGEKRA